MPSVSEIKFSPPNEKKEIKAAAKEQSLIKKSKFRGIKNEPFKKAMALLELANFFESSRKWFKNDDDLKCLHLELLLTPRKIVAQRAAVGAVGLQSVFDLQLT